MLRFIERITYPLAIITAVLGLVYWYWTTTPTYALTAVIVSLKNRDPQMFQKYVDIDSVASHAFDDVTEGPARSMILGSRFDNFIGAGFIRFFKREIIGMAHEKVLDLVSDGTLKVDANAAILIPGSGFVLVNSTPKPKPVLENNDTSFDGGGDLLDTPRLSPKIRYQLRQYGFTRDGFKGIKYLKINGGNAFLGLEFFAPKINQNFVVELKMEDAGGYWHFTELSNLNDLISQYYKTRDYAKTSLRAS